MEAGTEEAAEREKRQTCLEERKLLACKKEQRQHALRREGGREKISACRQILKMF